ncbi:cytochrome P450 6B7-like [Cydia fagiglandana]|uniref:cytochrome P450 6B7-like n=1 Tax=Cydia fagiglandana TaxID=1458189 RepID=UPI002FEE621D
MLSIILVVLVASLVYLYGTRSFKYWVERGVKHDKPLPVFGNALDKFLQRISLCDLYSEAYRKYPNEKLVGLYLANDPKLILRDPELIKHVLTTDFQHFHPRGILPAENDLEPMFRNIFFADGDLWKLLRQRLTPAFTSGKLKAMFTLIVERAEKLQAIAIDAAEAGVDVDMRDLMARYTTDLIGACGFGIDADSLIDENSTFRQLGKRSFKRTKRDGFVAMLKFIAPKLFRKLHFLAPEIERYTMSIVRDILGKRNYLPVGRNDFVDLLLELKQKGAMVGESLEKRNPDGTPEKILLELDLILMASQILVFFIAGFDTSSSATSYLLHQLAFHSDAQKKCQEEIDEVLSRHGRLCFEAVEELKYLKMCFREAMRMFPPIGYLMRRCTGRYTFPGTNVTIDKGIGVVVPIHAMQNDEQYFLDPSEFRPERFSSENVSSIPNHVYLPFGEGPRACIGERLGMLQSLAGVAALLQRCSVEPGPTTVGTPITDPTSTITQNISGGLPLIIRVRTPQENKILEAREDKNQVAVLCCDLSKAFDVADHNLLTDKLRHYGLGGPALALMADLLRNRKQVVMADSGRVRSDAVVTSMGVAQDTTTKNPKQVARERQIPASF